MIRVILPRDVMSKSGAPDVMGYRRPPLPPPNILGIDMKENLQEDKLRDILTVPRLLRWLSG